MSPFHPHLIDPDRAFLLVVDYQERYRGVLHEWERTVERASILVRGAVLLGIPVLYTEQYPRGLGPTCTEMGSAFGHAEVPRFEKRTLSALGAPGLVGHLEQLLRRQAIVAGIETHACVSQTVHDLLVRGFAVHLPVDALSSRRPFEHEQGLAKMLRAGALPCSVEQALFELLRSADHPEFKAIQQLVK